MCRRLDLEQLAVAATNEHAALATRLVQHTGEFLPGPRERVFAHQLTSRIPTPQATAAARCLSSRVISAVRAARAVSMTYAS